MTSRDGIKRRLLLSCGVLLLTSMLTVCAHAQGDTLAPTVPLSPGLAPPLTDNPQTEAVTTLSTNLLTPQRPYIFDPSGASIIANSLNPEIFSSSLGSSLVKTDTQIRDSSQAGQISPYASAAHRLGLTPAGNEGPLSQGDGITSNGSSRRIHNPGGDNGQSTMDNPYQSSWGSNSSFGQQSEESSWGTGRLSADRLGRRPQNSLAAAPGTDSALATARDSNDTSISPPFSRSGARANPPAYGSINGRLTTNASRYGSIGSQAGSTNASNKWGQSPTGNMATDTGNLGADSTMGQASTDKAAVSDTLTYFPQANSEEPRLGESPFFFPG